MSQRTLWTLALAVVASSVFAQDQLSLSNPTKTLDRSPEIAQIKELAEKQELALEDLVTVALVTNRSYATALANLEAARGRTSEARTGVNPTVGFNSTFTQIDDPVVANLGPTPITIQNRYNPVLNAAITLPIDLFGSIRAAIGSAQFREVGARIEVNRIRNEVVFAVRNAFYGALRARASLVVAEENLRNSRTRLSDAEALLRAGTGTNFDVLTAQRDVADAEGAVVRERGAATLALANLKSVVGLDISSNLKIVDSGAVDDPAGDANPITVASEGRDYRHAQNEVELGDDYKKAVEEAIASRPEVLESNAAISAAEKGVAYARRSTLPSLSVSAGYNVQPNFAGFTPANQASVALNLAIPIFDGGLARAREREAKAAVEGARTDRRSAIDAVTLDVQQAYVNLVQARQRIAVANVGVKQAREAFRLARLRSQAGITASPQVSPQIELSNAQTTLTQAETNRVNALYDYNIARSALDRAVGRYSYGTGKGFAQAPTSKETGQVTPTKN